MEVLNVHQRKVEVSKERVVALFSTLATKDDKIWPKEKWPRMKLKNGLQEGSEGGHGPIRYQITEYDPTACIVFEFQKPEGFNGVHKFEITETGLNETQIKHTIKMKTSGMGTVKWGLAIRWLHDALIEDAFDKIENQLIQKQEKTAWNLWVKILRAVLK